ncbi:type III secretion system invasion protein IagB [Chromobacterium sp. CV08]|uniref:type III secretion system invasion protein IagB n=1 Tax=Chromobacterium sp. CV08 TaxID=3133274 RepID=UPI003DA965B4
MKGIALGAALLLGSLSARADCWDRAGAAFNIEPDLLYAIAQQESGLRPDAVGRNRDGSRDLGLMQINSVHLPRLRALGIDEKRLLGDACLSVMVGASILADMMKRYGYSWEAVGAYNAGPAPGRRQLRMRYARQVWQRYQLLRTAR